MTDDGIQLMTNLFGYVVGTAAIMVAIILLITLFVVKIGAYVTGWYVGGRIWLSARVIQPLVRLSKNDDAGMG